MELLHKKIESSSVTLQMPSTPHFLWNEVCRAEIVWLIKLKAELKRWSEAVPKKSLRGARDCSAPHFPACYGLVMDLSVLACFIDDFGSEICFLLFQRRSSSQSESKHSVHKLKTSFHDVCVP